MRMHLLAPPQARDGGLATAFHLPQHILDPLFQLKGLRSQGVDGRIHHGQHGVLADHLLEETKGKGSETIGKETT